MDVKFLEQIKNDLQILKRLPENCFEEIAEMGCSYLIGGLNKNHRKAIALANNVDAAEIENAVTSIALLLLQLHKSQVPIESFQNEIAHLSLPVAATGAIYSVYRQRELDLQNILRGCDYQSTQYKDLHWRLESQLASRSLRGGYQPRVVLKLSLERLGKEENIALVSDIPNIIHWNKMVEEALAEVRTQDSRRLQRMTL